MAVIAHHLVWTIYGTWLGNDPRGSGSTEVYTPKLAALGKAHLGRRKVQPTRNKVRDFYKVAEAKLQYPVIRFILEQILEVGHAFARLIQEQSYTCYACAIMPDHVHLVVRKHKHSGEEMIEHFQRQSRIVPSLVDPAMMDHPIWTKGGWDRFLDSSAAVRTRVRYVEGNPQKEGLPPQAWAFVKEYDDWPHHKRPR
jgi:REP element-mobilizing transposase RayT